MAYIYLIIKRSFNLFKGTDQNGIPFWILKPKELLKLFISNPKVSSKIVRLNADMYTLNFLLNPLKIT